MVRADLPISNAKNKEFTCSNIQHYAVYQERMIHAGGVRVRCCMPSRRLRRLDAPLSSMTVHNVLTVTRSLLRDLYFGLTKKKQV